MRKYGLCHFFVLSIIISIEEDNYNSSYIYNYICDKIRNNNESESSSIWTGADDTDLTLRESFNNLDVTPNTGIYGFNVKIVMD